VGVPGAATIMNFIVLTAVLSCLNSGVYVTARVLFAMADKGDAPRWLTAVNRRQVPARAILLGSAFGFIVMLLNWIAPEKLFNFLMNSSGALMMFTYTFVALAHFRFPYSRPELRVAGGATWIAGGAALAMLAVMLAMAFMPSKQPEMVASLTCLVVIGLALGIKRALTKSA
jgi:L-asparagine transporter-like permease